MSGAGLLRLPDAVYDTGLLALYGLEDATALLPPLLQPSDIVGVVTAEAAAATGLAKGTPVVAGYFDVVASALGSGAVGAGAASVVVGSWSINQVFSDAPVRDDRVFMVAAYGARPLRQHGEQRDIGRQPRMVCARAGRARRATTTIRSASSMKWSPALPRRMTIRLFHPFLYGGRLGAHQRGGFFGVAGWHGEGHLLRAIFEGVMFEHRRHVEVLAEAGVTFSTAALSGGGSRSVHWPQMFADGLGVPVTVAEARETGALGAAMAAAIGVGLYPAEAEAVAAMATASTSIQLRSGDARAL